jgi:hypothetical protein
MSSSSLLRKSHIAQGDRFTRTTEAIAKMLKESIVKK